MGLITVGLEQCRSERSSGDFARSTLVEFIGRPHVYVFNQDCLISPCIDLDMKLMPCTNNFLCKSASPAQNAAQENFKQVPQSVNLIIHIKHHNSTALNAHMELL